MSITVRRATPDDIQGIAEVHVTAWHARYRGMIPDSVIDSYTVERRAELWTQWIGNPAITILVSLEGERVAGFASLNPSRDADAAPATAELTALYVDPKRWRGGHGRALVEAGVNAVQALEYQKLTLWVLEANAPARAFYEALGFVPDGATKGEKMRDETLFEVRYSREL